MKILKLCTTILLALSLLLSFAACDSDAETTSKELPTKPQEPSEIIINTDGATMPEQENGADMKFADAVKIVPTKEGYAFAGWYSDEALTDYIIPEHITATQYSKGTLYAKWIKVDPVSVEIRTGVEVTITDSGRAKQHMDILYLENVFNMTDLIRAGYTKLRVTVSLDICEVNDGYQHVFLYSDRNCVQPEEDSLVDALYGDYLDKILGSDEGDPSLITEYPFEHGASKKDTSWSTHTEERLISIDQVKDNLYIRYGASGKEEDNWKNKNVVITITPEK